MDEMQAHREAIAGAAEVDRLMHGEYRAAGLSVEVGRAVEREAMEHGFVFGRWDGPAESCEMCAGPIRRGDVLAALPIGGGWLTIHPHCLLIGRAAVRS